MKLDKAQRIEVFIWVLLKLFLVLVKPLAWWSNLKKGPGCVERMYLTLGWPWKWAHLPEGMKLEILHNLQFSKAF